MKVDAITKKWIRNRSDEIAVERGCRFDQDRADHAVSFIQENLCLYEGEGAGELVKLMPWQIDFVSRLFGWVRWSERFQRWVRRFRKASLWVAKKNGKSPLAAMIGLYLLIADGEDGQKVFSAAKDGKQALIMHTHAEKMAERSPRLAKLLTINHTTHEIRFNEKNSVYRVLAGDNITSQEGINGSVIIDEVHVVDDRLARTIEYAGASRSEPIQLEVSTAGDNPLGYGKRQYDYGKRVESGATEDIEFLFVCYEAPQNATDEECGTPRVLRLANPSLGVTVTEEELLSTYRRASESVSDLASWKKYRLNIWQTSASPWLKIDDWTACYRGFTEDDLAGRHCYGGLDLAKTRDMSAFALAFPPDSEDNPWHLLCKFWVPESAVVRYYQFPFQQWQKEGWLRILPGNVADYRSIVADIVEWSRKFLVRNIGYDRRFADLVAVSLQDDYGLPIDEFPQGIAHFAAPTSEFERIVIDGRLRHNGNPILSWQAGHVQVKQDEVGNKRPIKPDRDSPYKIDGIVASIMAVGMACLDNPPNINRIVSETGGFVFA